MTVDVWLFHTLSRYSPSCAVPAQENLRQLCVFKLANQSNQPWQWWDYVTRFAGECKMSEQNYNEECAEKARPRIGVCWVWEKTPKPVDMRVVPGACPGCADGVCGMRACKREVWVCQIRVFLVFTGRCRETAQGTSSTAVSM